MEIEINENPPQVERSFSLTITDENAHIIGEAILTDKAYPFVAKAWQVSLIEVDKKYQRKGYGTALYRRCKEFAAEHGCAVVVPSADMSWDEFALWRALDPDALRKILTHDEAITWVDSQGGDIPRLMTQIALIGRES